jgi:hypothetical protein
MLPGSFKLLLKQCAVIDGPSSSDSSVNVLNDDNENLQSVGEYVEDLLFF